MCAWLHKCMHLHTNTSCRRNYAITHECMFSRKPQLGFSQPAHRRGQAMLQLFFMVDIAPFLSLIIRSEMWVTERIVQKQNSRSMLLSATSTLSDPRHPTVLLSLSLPAAKATASPRNANESLGSSIPAVAGAASLWEWQMCYNSWELPEPSNIISFSTGISCLPEVTSQPVTSAEGHTMEVLL